MIGKMGINKNLWTLIAFLSLAAALTGILNPSIYNKVVDTKIIPGVLSQDLMTIMVSLVMLALMFRLKEQDIIKQIITLGIVGYLFYAYGIYVIERLYNSLYFLYMAIFALAFYSLVYSLANINFDQLRRLKLPKTMRYISVGFSLFIPILFYPMWISHLLTLIKTSTKIEFLYSVYILDMVFVLPIFIIISIMTAKNQGLGIFLTPTLFLKGFTLLFSVGIGELLKPLYNQRPDPAGMGLYLGLSIVFLLLTLLYFRKLKING